MADESAAKVGSITWRDLTVEDAEQIRDFYKAVVGWESEDVDMGGYSDFGMNMPGGECVAGICHARGENAQMPPQWMVYITVADLDESIRNCRQMGGKLRTQVRSMGSHGRFCVIEDPAGAVAALIEPVK